MRPWAMLWWVTAGIVIVLALLLRPMNIGSILVLGILLVLLGLIAAEAHREEDAATPARRPNE